jgi:hypothetical protein
MNYDKVKNPFDMYDDVDEIEEFEDDEPLEPEDEQKEKPANSRLLSVFMIASYILILILAFFGIVALCNPETRNSVLFIM